MKLIILALLAATSLCNAAESVIRVTPGSPKETFIIGATTTKNGDSVIFEITITPRTTKPTLPFDCTLAFGATSVGWQIDSPCYNERKKVADTETIRISIPESKVKDATFEFRYLLDSIDTIEIWTIELKDYRNGVKPE